MNRTQLPRELKAVFCRQVRQGKWTMEQAAEISTFSVQTVKRWLEDYDAANSEGSAPDAPAPDPEPAKPKDPRPLEPDLRRILDAALERVPSLRQRSLVDYVRRHYGCKVPRRAAAAYLKERGLVERSTVKVEQPMRRFEAPTPLNLVQVDLVYVPKIGGGWLFSLNCLDDHSRMLLGATALEEQTGKAVLKAFRDIVEQWGQPTRVLTDRGTQFVHWRGRTAFQKYVEGELKAEHILAAARHPQTVGKLERFHSSLRQEGLDPKGYPDLKSLQDALDRYRGYYNHERPNQGIGGMVPADRFYGMAKPLEEGWRKLTPGCGPDQGVFLTMNLLGRRLVLAGPRPEQLRVLWDDELRPLNGARKLSES
jgi:transposase InsO family protein